MTSAADAVERTAACEADRHHLCRGTIVSLTATNGASCCCACHLGDDRAVEAALERHHYDDPFDHGYGDS